MTTGAKIGIVFVVLGGILGIGGAVYALKPKDKQPGSGTKMPEVKTTPSGGGGSVGGSSGSGGGSSQTKSAFPLKNGSRDSGSSRMVVRLQFALQGLGKNISSDGIFGPKTEAALKSVTGKTTVASEAELAAIENKQYNKEGVDLITPPADNKSFLNKITGGIFN